MKRSFPALALVALAASQARAQQPAYQQESRFQFKIDGLFRQEWTKDILNAPDESRWRLRLLPRLEVHLDKLVLGVGGDFNYSKDENTEPRPPLIRDNYKSRDARLDLAFASLKPAGWLHLQAGRFEVPVALTEMIWDRDLRPQGGAVTATVRSREGLERLELTALAARGSHVFDDGKLFGDGTKLGTTLTLFAAEATFTTGKASRLQLLGSYLRFTRTGALEPMIRRQNTRVAGVLVNGYEVVDVVARLRQEGGVTLQLVADYCWNRAVDENNKGLWLALVLGSTQTANGSLEYTYARVDKDATLAAYGTDDFFWTTGWEGHRGDIGLRASDRSAIHVVGQLQRFKDSPRVEERDHWVKRLRIEMRIRP